MKNVLSPVGELVGYVGLAVPSTTFSKYGTYNCHLIFRGEDAVAMLDGIDNCMEMAVAKYKMEPGAPPYEIDGRTLIVKFKASGKNKVIPFLDLDGKPVDKATIILRQSSKVRILFEPFLFGMEEYGAGVSLRIISVTIVELAPEPEVCLDVV